MTKLNTAIAKWQMKIIDFKLEISNIKMRLSVCLMFTLQIYHRFTIRNWNLEIRSWPIWKHLSIWKPNLSSHDSRIAFCLIKSAAVSISRFSGLQNVMILVAYLRRGLNRECDDFGRFLQDPVVIQLETFKRRGDGKVKNG